jgi:hypothetical protein
MVLTLACRNRRPNETGARGYCGEMLPTAHGPGFDAWVSPQSPVAVLLVFGAPDEESSNLRNHQPR